MVYLKFLVLSIVILALLPVAIAQESKGRVYTLTYSPAEPVVAQSVTISVGVENPDSIDHDYSLKVFITKDGRIKHEDKFGFSLKAGRGIAVSPTYVPDDIGQFEVLVKLYDKFEIELLSLKLLKFNSVSQIGPFDLELDVPTNVVRPDTRLPVILQLVNMGEKGTDAETEIKMVCQTKSDSTEKFIVFLKPHETLKKVISLVACPEEGLHEVTGAITLFNKTWISTTSQVFLNYSFIELQFDIPESFVLKPGESKVFDLPVKNLGNKIIHNLQIIVSKLPQSWVKVNPKIVIEVDPQETAVFIVNITVPLDGSGVYDFGISAAADETLLRKQTSLQITDLQEKSGFNLPSLPTPNISGDFPNVNYLILIGGGFIVSVFIIRVVVTKSRSSHQRIGLLAKIRSNLSPSKSGEFKVITLRQFKQEMARKRR